LITSFLSRLGRFLLRHPWIPTLLLFQVTGVIVMLEFPAINVFDWEAYAFSFVVGALFLIFLQLVRSKLPRIGVHILAALTGILFALIIAANVTLYRTMGEFVTVHMLTYYMGDVGSMSGYARSYLFGAFGLIILAVAAGFYLLWKPRQESRSLPWKKWSGSVAVVLALFFVLLNQLKIAAPNHLLSVDGASILAVKSYFIFQGNATVLCSTRHTKPDSLKDASPYNVVLIVNESWGKKGLSFYGSADTAMPYLCSWIEKERNSFVVFEHAFTNSSATDVSMPSILTGVAPFESGHKLHEMPFLWDWAHAAGMRTSFVSSQRYKWASRFLYVPGPDLHKTAEDINAPVILDCGVDDLETEPEVANFIHTSKGRPFFAIYNPNAMHGPFQQTSTHITKQPSFESKYENAAFILDETIHRVCQTLADEGQLDHTIIILTADHGETDKPLHPPRISSFYEEIMSIPFVMYLPEKWKSEHTSEYEALRANAHRNVMNLDIAPTLVDVLQAHKTGRNDSLAQQFQGASLLRPADPHRVCVALNTNDLRHWDHEGFGVFWDNYRFVFNDAKGAQLFDISKDPDQRTNIWYQKKGEFSQLLTPVIQNNRFLANICRQNASQATAVRF
jgi:glucan phosphoethanolaminetransferase (alkaline phosphatase superfamily)